MAPTDSRRAPLAWLESRSMSMLSFSAPECVVSVCKSRACKGEASSYPFRNPCGAATCDTRRSYSQCCRKIKWTPGLEYHAQRTVVQAVVRYLPRSNLSHPFVPRPPNTFPPVYYWRDRPKSLLVLPGLLERVLASTQAAFLVRD